MRIERILAGVVLLIPQLFTMGCSSIPTVSGMTFEPPPSAYTASGKTVFVSEAPNAPQDSGLRQSSFVEALKGSIEKSALFGFVEQPTEADYHLLSSIADYRHPQSGFNMTCDLAVRYTLNRPSGSEPVWRKQITTSKTCGFSDAWVGVKRQRLAIEGAARKNIEQVLAELSALDL